MEDHVTAVDVLREQRFVGDGVDRIAEPRVRFEWFDVVDRASGEVVQYEHLVPDVEQCAGEVRADEAGSAGDQGSHGVAF